MAKPSKSTAPAPQGLAAFLDTMGRHAWLLAFGFGLTFIITLLVLAVAFPASTPFQYFVFRVVLALAAAGAAGAIPGMTGPKLKPSTKFLLHVGSALAVFVIVYTQDPAKLVLNPQEPLSTSQSPTPLTPLYTALSVVVFIFGVIGGLAFSRAAYEYLKGEEPLKPTHESVESPTATTEILQKFAEYEVRISAFEQTLKSLAGEVGKLQTALLEVGAPEKAALVEKIKERIIQIATESFLTDLKIKAAETFQKNLFEQNVIRTFEESRKRLAQEWDALNRRGNVNLILGMGTTLIGLYALWTFVTSSPEWPKEGDPLTQFSIHFIPRLTLIIFIELFAYFFLRLYRTGLEEIKYFQNEITNLEAKHIALVSAIETKDPAVITDVIGKLATTERNRILTKDQTTVELESIRIEKQGTTDLAKPLADLISSLVPKKSG